MNAAKPPFWLALRAHLAADRRKTATLVVLLVVLLGIYARWFWGSSPAQAGAASVATASTNPTGATSALPAAPTRIKPARPLVRDLVRDPFAVRLDRFQVDPTAVTTRPSAPSTMVPSVQPANQPSLAQPGFQLQSIISGTLPMAWINGRCVQPGESIDGFAVEQIEPTRVVLRRGNEVRVLTID